MEKDFLLKCPKCREALVFDENDIVICEGCVTAFVFAPGQKKEDDSLIAFDENGPYIAAVKSHDPSASIISTPYPVDVLDSITRGAEAEHGCECPKCGEPLTFGERELVTCSACNAIFMSIVGLAPVEYLNADKVDTNGNIITYYKAPRITPKPVNSSESGLGTWQIVLIVPPKK